MGLLVGQGFLGAKAPLRPGFAKKNSVFLCKGTKAALFALFCKAEFLDSMSVLALECFSAYGTGGLISEFSVSWIRWLWLTAFDK